jgi:hypothetical protein
MSFTDDEIFQSPEYRFGRAVNFGAVNGGAVNCGATSSKHELSVGFGGAGNFGSISAVAHWSNNDLHSAVLANDAGINSAANNLLDLATVATLFFNWPLDLLKKPLPSNISYSPTIMDIPAQSKTAIAFVKEHEQSGAMNASLLSRSEHPPE